MIRVCLAQLNFIVGDISGNYAKITKAIKDAKENSADLIVFSELSLTGYPPEDLLYKPHFIQKNIDMLNEIKEYADDIVVVVGFVDKKDNDIYNALAVLGDKELKGIYHKIHLPNYGVFDEERYFQNGEKLLLLELNKAKIGFAICEDIWQNDNPIEPLAKRGAEVIVNINASPFSSSKLQNKEDMLKTRARDNMVFIVYANQVGSQDELVFDGGSKVISPKGEVLCSAKLFEEDLLFYDLQYELSLRLQLKDTRLKRARRQKDNCEIEQISIKLPSKNYHKLAKTQLLIMQDEIALIYKALIVGLKDYILKNGFSKVVIGLSGGIDSALSATIAVDALGAENVLGVLMPSQFSSKSSIDDATLLAKNLGIKTHTIKIEDIFESFMTKLKPIFNELPFSTAEENLQARIRGMLLMSISNKFGHIVIATGNKSEMSVGYSTLYGDLAGGFALLKDVFKTTVYELANYRNSISPVIPQNSITKPPSAELRADQKDEDELPPYDVLDKILQAFVEDDYSKEEIINMGFDEKVVQKVLKLVDMNEYKRRQAPIGVKISNKAFGKDRRMPLTNKFSEYL